MEVMSMFPDTQAGQVAAARSAHMVLLGSTFTFPLATATCPSPTTARGREAQSCCLLGPVAENAAPFLSQVFCTEHPRSGLVFTPGFWQTGFAPALDH